MEPQLFFGASTGRTATMAFANALNSEIATTCLHEGKFRHEEISGEKILPFLTLENRLAYEDRQIATEIVAAKRGNVIQLARDRGDVAFGDIAYNNVPFIEALANQYPRAKFVFFFRNCIEFLRSAASETGVDETPVGWPPQSKSLTNVERFIAMGRLQPKQGTEEAYQWNDWTYRAKNIWLWAETNRMLLEQAQNLPKNRYHVVYFDEFKSDPIGVYQQVRKFLCIQGTILASTKDLLLARPINQRIRKPALTGIEDLDNVERMVFEKFAKPVNRKLKF